MILADTSAWVEYDRATGSAVDRRLSDLVSAGGALGVTEPVVMEVLSGARDDPREAQLRRLLARFQLLHFDASVDFSGAALVYRKCRSKGITPRGLIDCMVATVAWRNQAALLSFDADLTRVAQVIGVALDEASLGV